MTSSTASATHFQQLFQPQSVPIVEDDYLKLFPHRGDFIQSPHPETGEFPTWSTESRHFLSDRLIQQGAYLYGVRFGAETRYLMLDIDAGSLYHPQRDRLAIKRLMASLEPLGGVSSVAVTSSYSSGIHLYIPFQQAQKSWAIAQAAAALLETGGFKLKPGQLEIFPNPRGYSEQLSLYAAHRLPLQAGSYLLDADLEPVSSSKATFVWRWQQAAGRNAVTTKAVDRVLKQYRRKAYKIGGSAAKFLNDLDAEIEPGWTGPGQTNHLLGRVVLREYVFGHVQQGSSPLSGDDLIGSVLAVVQNLPGYEDWCEHQHEIVERIGDWVRSVQESRYYPYGTKKQPLGGDSTRAEQSSELSDATDEPVSLTWNQRQSQEARERIMAALRVVIEQGLPSRVSDRIKALEAQGIGAGSLYRHRDLWHPNCLSQTAEPIQSSLFTPVEADCLDTECLEPIQSRLFAPVEANKLMQFAANPLVQAAMHLIKLGGSRGVSTGSRNDGGDPVIASADSASAQSIARQVMAEKARRLDHAHVQKQRQLDLWAESGDPILMSEAMRSVQAIHQPAIGSALETDRNLYHYLLGGQSGLGLIGLSAAAAATSPDADLVIARADTPAIATTSFPPPSGFSSAVLPPVDLSDLICQIQIDLRRLAWTSAASKQFIADRFDGKSRAQLNEQELRKLTYELRVLV